MFDFFKKKNNSPSGSSYDKLFDEVQALKNTLPEFDPYDMQTLRRSINTRQTIIKKYTEFLDNNKGTPEFDWISDGLELERDTLKWEQDLYALMLDILELSKTGIIQSDIKKRLPEANPQQITQICKRFEADKVISREKKGSSYYITLP